MNKELTEMREATLKVAYEDLASLELGSKEFLDASMAIKNLSSIEIDEDRVLSETKSSSKGAIVDTIKTVVTLGFLGAQFSATRTFEQTGVETSHVFSNLWKMIPKIGK